MKSCKLRCSSGKNVYDGWINDSDLIGTHFRYGQTIVLSDYMTGEGKDVTDPMLDLHDFIGKSFTTGPDKKLYQLPDQQFANLYWFRYDWFTNPDYKSKFKAKYGYELGVHDSAVPQRPSRAAAADACGKTLRPDRDFPAIRHTPYANSTLSDLPSKLWSSQRCLPLPYIRAGEWQRFAKQDLKTRRQLCAS